ncbi:MAG: hypothetical protein ACRCX5_01505, partial [Bacteroidales bacterium]
MRNIVDLENWDRKSNYMFFKDFLNPSFSVTSEVECGELFAAAKEYKYSLALTHVSLSRSRVHARARSPS